jgi:hypothetical protein
LPTARRAPSCSNSFPIATFRTPIKVSNAIRQQVADRGAMANIPPKANRKRKNCFSPFLYRNRNAIERMFRRRKDFRRIATRCDRNAVNFLAAVCIAATIGYWLRVLTISGRWNCRDARTSIPPTSL